MLEQACFQLKKKKKTSSGLLLVLFTQIGTVEEKDAENIPDDSGHK